MRRAIRNDGIIPLGTMAQQQEDQSGLRCYRSCRRVKMDNSASINWERLEWSQNVAVKSAAAAVVGYAIFTPFTATIMAYFCTQFGNL